MVEEGAVTAPRSNKLWTVCIFILAVECCERLCYYSIGGTMRNYLTAVKGGYSNGQAGAINASFTMLSYLSCFLGGYLADNWLGRFKTILIFAICYFAGTVMVAIAVIPGFYNLELYLAGTMIFIAIGTGAIKPNVMNFGASQYDDDEKQEQKAFFSYFYMMINVGAGVSFGFLANVATRNVDAKTQDPGDGFLICYAIAASAMGLAVIFFILGSKRYKPEPRTVHKPMISLITKYICRSAFSPFGMCSVSGWCLLPIYIVLSLLGSIVQDETVSGLCTQLALWMCIASCLLIVLGHLRNDWIKEFREPIIGAGMMVEHCKQTMALVPQLLLINIGFNVCYNAMNNAYPSLACQMDLRIAGTQLNGAFANLGDCIAIIIGVPIIEGCIFPVIERNRGRLIPRRVKYIWGFLLAILANASAVVVELMRRNADFIPGTEGESQCAAQVRPPIHMSNISGFIAFIPMLITGIAEILVNPVVYQFAFTAAPSSLMSVVQAFNLIVAGAISNAITGPLSTAIFPNNLNMKDASKYNKTNATGLCDDDSCLAGACGGGNGCGDVNLTFYVNIGIGAACLVLYLIVDRIDEVAEEDLSLPEDGEQSRSFVGAGERMGGEGPRDVTVG